MTVEGSGAEPRLPVTALLNDYITGYMGAVGASAALVKRATEGGSWHVTVSLTGRPCGAEERWRPTSPRAPDSSS